MIIIIITIIIITTDTNNNNTEASYALVPSRSNFFIFAELTYTLGTMKLEKGKNRN